ncbi:MAG: hypothetical protein HFF44_05290 [Lawsonibacter sp.]|nr:hypothetical protein [Lawsonibacter sp.]
MVRIGNIPLPVGGGMDQLRRRAARELGVRPGELGELKIVRQSIDARKKQDVHYVYTVELSLPDEGAAVRRAPGNHVTLVERVPYTFPAVRRRSSLPPVVVGMGPAGLFAALFLARSGLPCVVLERGQDVDRRTLDVGDFWVTGKLDEGSNVQFGEGGAGTFSDGKLTTGTHDARISAVLDTLVEAGAPADVKYSHKPHIGTDVLREVVKAIRKELIALGCDVRFGHRLTGLTVSSGALAGVEVEGPAGRCLLAADAVVLAPGHSARDTFAMLQRAGVPMEQKKFAVGVRIEHKQRDISLRQYGPAWDRLPPSDYKLACHLPSGRSAFTFCVCPGGEVVAAASERGGLVTNGMSCRARDGENINGGLLVGVGPEDFPGEDVLSGVRFQQQWERAAFTLGGGGFAAPVQRVEDFLLGQSSEGPGAVLPTYRPGVAWTDLSPCLPGCVTDTLRGALPLLDRKLRGFAHPDAVLTGVETRSSSPVRILRDENYQSSLRGLYPCGEGAGYAGGIVSAAVDGIRVAEAVAGG